MLHFISFVGSYHIFPSIGAISSNNNFYILPSSTGVFLTGGVHEGVCRKLKDTELEQLLYQRYQEPGFVIGGTSAGVHAISDQMIVENSCCKQTANAT
ncbi:Type 1 glutamine amidotransferase-like domain-containing protein [Iningainema tapete]|uniref:Type 1 glutamine amidotransferase-like domain-containing protein n=1 Tax=Iningainema tapete BLCC-T55 TaxID=2748662 RepID=A0A8J6XTB7_9CYAN|nr:Type 1 glutamine amidotransferase-like domain-containing protein [Iningainema tapete]MBD2777171.1 Type 1 glutamine amidotransferase-like domain-containing protein [Iningainema tapete BLCC-T55]